MCHKIKTIAKIRSGELSICKQCNIYHLSFNNLFFEFTPEELNNFKTYISSIKVEYWEEKYACAKIERKIPIPSLQPNLFLMFNKQEIDALKTLFSTRKKGSTKFLNVDDIDYTYVLN